MMAGHLIPENIYPLSSKTPIIVLAQLDGWFGPISLCCLKQTRKMDDFYLDAALGVHTNIKKLIDVEMGHEAFL